MTTIAQPTAGTGLPSAADSAAADRFLDRRISLQRLELVELAVPQVESFRSAVGWRHERQALYVRWHDRDGAWGIGECSCRPDPFYSGEFVAGAVTVLSDFVFPALARRGTVAGVVEAVGRVRGWRFTVAAVLDAVSDLLRRRGEPDLVDLWSGDRTARVPVGVSLGIYDDAGKALERVSRAVEDGYRRVKLKLEPGIDRSTLEAVRAAFPDLALGFDANGSMTRRDLDFLASLAELHPAMVEQPFAAGRLDLCGDLKELAPELQICLDESVEDLGLLRAARRLGVIDELNLKPGRVGGPLETVRILEDCRESGLPAWIGGMFETGVGRWANLRVAACLPAARAHDLSPSRRYFRTDVVEHPVTMGDDGCIDLTDDRPVALDEAAFERLTVNRVILERG